MATQHRVEPGDHIARIAHRYGFGDPAAVWDDGANAELRGKRKNPNVLLPGDVVHVPDRIPKKAPAATGKRHTFMVALPKLWLRIVVRDFGQEPLVRVDCRLTVDGKTRDLQTGGDGLVEVAIPPDAKGGSLAVPSLGMEIALGIGHLHPVDAPSGYRGRLNNLGYFAGRSDDPEDPALRSAIEEFQCDHGLTVDGVCGAGTQAKLLEVHGC